MIRILTDSTCDLLPVEAARLGVEVVHMQVRFEDGEVFRDGLDITPDEFYDRLVKCDKLPTTSQPSPQDFMDRFEEAKAAGDEVVAILISGLLSGTYQSARIAADSCEYDKIHLVDSMNATLGEQLLVRLAVQMRADGATAEEIVAELERRRMDVRLVAVVDDLKYFRKGGRLTGAQALAGSLLGVKPVVAVRDGKVGLAGKARGMPGAYVALFKLMDTEGGLDETMPYMIGYTAHRKAAEPIHRYLTQNLGLEAPLCRHIGTAIGTHAGPGAAAPVLGADPRAGRNGGACAGVAPPFPARAKISEDTPVLGSKFDARAHWGHFCGPFGRHVLLATCAFVRSSDRRDARTSNQLPKTGRDRPGAARPAPRARARGPRRQRQGTPPPSRSSSRHCASGRRRACP